MASSKIDQDGFELIDEYLRTKWNAVQVIILILSLIGILINTYAAFFLHKKKHKRVFVR